MVKTHRQTIINLRMKLRGLLRMALGRLFIYEKVFVLVGTQATNNSKVCSETVNKAKANVRLAQSGDILKLDKFKKFKGGKAEKRLNSGHLCFIAEKNGDIVNYTWVCFNEAFVDELERKIRVSPSSAYRYDGYTVPKYRGKGILPAVLTFAADYLFQNGIKEIYDLVPSNNYSSLRAHQKIGSRKIGEVTLTRLFKSRRYRFKGETARDFAKLTEMFSFQYACKCMDVEKASPKETLIE